MPGLLAPLFMLGALAAAVPIVLHLLKREPEARIRFAAVKLLQLAPVEQSARRRLREWLLLALRVSAVVLLSAAFARPFFIREIAAESAGLVVVALDTSFSLSAPGRFESARGLARAAIDRASPQDRVALVTFANAAQVAVPPTADRARVVAAIDEVEPAFGATGYRAALGAAAGLFAEERASAGVIVVVTDLQESGWSAGGDAVVPQGVQVELADVGPLVPNLAISEASVAAGGVAATVRNLGPDAREARVRLVVDGAAAGESRVSLAPGQAVRVVLPAGEAGRMAEVHVADPEGLQADNSRYVVLRGQAVTPVLVVTANGDLARDAFFLQQALLAAGPSGAAYTPDGTSAEALSGWQVTALHNYAAVALLSTRGLDARGRDVIREYAMRGGRLLVAAGPGIDGEVVAGALGHGLSVSMPAAGVPDPRGDRRTLVPVDVRHPVFRSVGGAGGTVGLVTFRRVAAVGASGCDLLARFTTGEAALVECMADGGRTLVFASDLNHEWNDFPRHGTFVPFLHEVVNYLSEGRQWGSDRAIEDVPEGIPQSPGFVTLPAARPGGEPRVVAVNVEAGESEPGRLTPEVFLAAVSHAVPSPSEGAPVLDPREPPGQQAWRYALFLLIGVLVLESVIGRRTV